MTRTGRGARDQVAVEERGVLRLLAEVGFAAVGHGLHAEATRIFDAMAITRPESVVADVGQALMAIGAGRYEDAVQHLWRDALAKEPDNQEVKQLLGLALQLAGRGHDSERFLKEVAAESKGDAAAEGEGEPSASSAGGPLAPLAIEPPAKTDPAETPATLGTRMLENIDEMRTA